jgi:1,4-dihydroxy-2-naphthoyl-CoA synthase
MATETSETPAGDETVVWHGSGSYEDTMDMGLVNTVVPLADLERWRPELEKFPRRA